MSTKCRSVNVPFFWASSFGFEGCFFTDLGEKYEFKDDAKKDSCTMSFPTLRSALDMKLNYLRTKKLDVSLTLFKFRVFETFRFESVCEK